MAIESNVKSMFGAINNKIKEVDAEYGSGGWWPQNGEHACYVTGVNVKASEFKFTAPSGEKKSLPGYEAVFTYQLIDDPEFDGPARSFRGEPFRQPADDSNLPSNIAQMVEISTKRLKGHLQTLTGATVVDVLRSLETVDAAISSGSVPAVMVSVTSRDHKGKTYRTEYLPKLIGNAQA